MSTWSGQIRKYARYTSWRSHDGHISPAAAACPQTHQVKVTFQDILQEARVFSLPYLSKDSRRDIWHTAWPVKLHLCPCKCSQASRKVISCFHPSHCIFQMYEDLVLIWLVASRKHQPHLARYSGEAVSAPFITLASQIICSFCFCWCIKTKACEHGALLARKQKHIACQYGLTIQLRRSHVSPLRLKATSILVATIFSLVGPPNGERGTVFSLSAANPVSSRYGNEEACRRSKQSRRRCHRLGNEFCRKKSLLIP